MFDGLDLSAAAALQGVSDATARRWKSHAKEVGDDWDKARGAHLIAGGGLEEVARQTLALTVLQVNATLDAITNEADMPAAAKAKALASLADSYNKLLSTSKRLMPETSQLATAMDVIQRLVQFVRDQYPQHTGALAEVLQPFGEEVARAYG
ncbi:DUF1804 family protein [Parachitinimonas caeni]|uniref:DUF1804 family protein n=1 Tax=Parachitinimonas caeni TaxID=3031301 RepID=UPI0024DE8ED7|nr:DUF1804 family protein [Parachitinimonas caeni]